MKPQVLIVDDSLTVRMDLKEAFEQGGFDPVLCGTVQEARNVVLKDSIQIVVLDVQLPDTDGVEFLKELRANSITSQLPVMFLTTEAEVRDRIRGFSTGADEYVGKPYEASYVIARARELLQKQHPVAQVRGMPTILVIDDSLTYRSELKSALETAGYSVLLSETGEEGLRVAVTSRPDAMVIDGKLPGIDGATVVRRVRSDVMLRNTPCLVLTASQDRSDEFMALEAGADNFVQKSADVSILLARLGAVLKSSQLSRQDHLEKSLLGPKRILAVDDSPTYIQAISDLLRDDGYDVVTAASGEEALALLEVQSVDCILLDRMMPGLSGEETCRRIKKSSNLRDIPLLILTAHEGQEEMLQGFSAGADDFISKSSEIDVLKARLRAQLRRKQFEDDNRRIREELIKREAEASEAKTNRELAEMRAVLVKELERSHKELETFSYSVSHDLRAPLRSVIGFSKALLEDYEKVVDDEGKKYLRKIMDSAHRMEELITGLLDFSRLSQQKVHSESVNLTEEVKMLIEELKSTQSTREIDCVIRENLVVQGDSTLLRVVLQNLLANAWKFTSKTKNPRIEFGVLGADQTPVYFVKDNGSGFNMKEVDKLFNAFQRLHEQSEFPGSGIGLATVQRIIQRHGGRVWAEGAVGEGATFYFTLQEKEENGKKASA